MEQIKDIKGLEGRYAVTSDGKVWSYVTKRFLRPGKIGNGYVGVMLPVGPGGAYRRKYLHRIVASAFLPNPEGKPCVNHKNGVKTDNNVGNLEWATYGENSIHAVVTGLLKVVGEDNPQAKLTEVDVEEIRQRYFYGPETQDELATAFNVHRVLIKMIVSGERWASTWKAEYNRPPRWKDSGQYAKRGIYDKVTAGLIREKYAEGGHTTRSLASDFGIHSSTVWKIIANKDWTAKVT